MLGYSFTLWGKGKEYGEHARASVTAAAFQGLEL